MSANVGYATLNVIPSAKNFGKTLTGQVSPGMTSAGEAGGSALAGGLKAVAGPLFAAAGAATMGLFVASAIRQAGALEQSMGAIDTVFRGSADQMHQWSASAATAVGLAKNDYNELAVLIGSQLKNAGTPMDELAGKTNNLVAAGADMASMFGGTTKEAVEAISSALKGERDPIERYGVSLNEAKIQAKLAEDAMNGVTYASEEQAKAAATLALIMEQTADAQGNFARESQTYEGVMQRLSASWQNITTTIGQGFLPIATAGGSVLLGMMPSIQGVVDKFAALAPAIQGVTEVLLFGNYDGGLFAAFSGLSEDSSFIEFLFDAREAVLALFTAGDPSLLTDLFVGLIQGAAGARDGLIASLGTLVPQILSTLVSMAPAILSAAVSSFSSLVTALITVVPSLLSSILGMLPSVVGAILSLLPMLLSSALTLFKSLVQALIVVIPQVITTLVAMLPQIAAMLVSMLPSLIAAALSLFMGIVEGLVQMVPVLITAVLELLPSLVSTLLGMLPSIIQSALTLFLGVVTALLTAIPQIIVTLLGMLPQLLSTIIGMIPQLIQAAVQLFKGLVEAIPRVLPLLIDALVQIGPKLVGTIVSMVPLLLRAGVDLIGGLVSGLWSAAGSVVNALLSIAGNAVDAFKSFFGIKSPSRLFMSFGGYMGEGLVIGIDRMEGAVTRSALNMANAAADAVSGVGLALGAEIGDDPALARLLATDLRTSINPDGIAGDIAARVNVRTTPDRITLVDRDGSILAKTTAVADRAVANSDARTSAALDTRPRRY